MEVNRRRLVRLWVRSGVTRHVLITRRWAVKVPNVRNGWRLFVCGLLANISEREWSQFVEAALPPNPTVFFVAGGWLNVQRRAQPYDGPIDHLDFNPWGDRKACNLGVIDGRIVVIDYDMNGRTPGCWANRHQRCCDVGCEGCVSHVCEPTVR